MRFIKLGAEEVNRAESANYVAIVTWQDLTDATASEAQVLNLCPIDVKMAVGVKKVELKTEFANSADTANNSTALTVGDTATANSFLTSMELNLNGTTVYLKEGTSTKTVYTATDNLKATFTPATGKTLASLTQGEVHIYVRIEDARPGIA